MNPGGWCGEGEGWRLAWDPARQPFSVLIGGAGWAAELTAGEALQLLQAIRHLVEQVGALTDQLMPEELVSLELERQPWWVGLEGDRSAWALRFVLTPGDSQRGIEGGWPAAASAQCLRAMEQWPLGDQHRSES
ncbi:DUF1818 family protein [Synechococcus sp. Tobar12-5m-g]|uniref:DUF1818 family protein n=1 Tax=unclassified Synechococcus TaxID=2626047 RepID=UPI0020CE4070|nr:MULTISPECIES: DUF1818 family protein [unclassified Synechococcus]MCP9771294.1 DUF1818 family protein [Synechococcus sp. Tobar12-5m-g]MCP9872234.1 DUF1818 family protein [Synechococcus sp. Cruz CV-v-12]